MKIEGSVILRYMRDASRFTRASPELTPPIAVALQGDEMLVGWYVNDEPLCGAMIVFTDDAMTFGTLASHRRLAYTDVLKSHFPKKESETTHLMVTTTSGPVEIVIAHSLRGRDAFCLGLALWQLSGRR